MPTLYCRKHFGLGGALFGTILFSMALAGCEKRDGDQAPAPNSQIVARLGDQVITVQELDTEFRFANVPNEKRRDPDLVKRVLGDLVTRKYLVQKAMSAKLDREPSVLLDMMRAREQVLANGFSQRQLSTQAAAVSKTDVDNFIANNPGKFSNQQVLNIEQVSVPTSLVSQDTVDMLKNMPSLDDVDRKLTSLGISHGRSSSILSSAEIPDDLLKSINVKGDGGVFFAKAGQNGVFFVVKGRETRPVEGEGAAILARQLLRADTAKAEASMASFSANMIAKYEGDYAKIMNEPAKPNTN
jgi:EpsD family peptidyl-prolyl cis-trans isomerase